MRAVLASIDSPSASWPRGWQKHRRIEKTSLAPASITAGTAAAGISAIRNCAKLKTRGRTLYAPNQTTKAMRIQLTDMEWVAARIIGVTRRSINRARQTIDRQMGKQDPIEIEVDGVAAEFALHRYLNRYPTDVFITTPRAGSADLDRIDIKSTRHFNGRLLATTKENNDVDVYVLAVIEPPYVELRGWTYASDLRAEENLIDLGHGVGYGMNQAHPKFRRLS